MTVKVRFWDGRPEYAALGDTVLEAVTAVIDSGQFILGEQVQTFEAALASFCGVEHGVGVNSGTDALFLALKALGIGDGDEVITVANTAIPTVSAIESAGARARFVDTDPGTYLMNPAGLEAAIGPRTRCILPVRFAPPWGKRG